ncbi:hypothetical protein NPIL_390101 [Nephila pilipes]|uniref:Uncharacterized protein n=1 Tax=Nephila pilipes TaxID=299642 RepID=A0A8X6QTG8_NEPPI|nr:hypothetical protein NPIL_390101 [Nephila pilipes]
MNPLNRPKKEDKKTSANEHRQKLKNILKEKRESRAPRLVSHTTSASYAEGSKNSPASTSQDTSPTTSHAQASTSNINEIFKQLKDPKCIEMFGILKKFISISKSDGAHLDLPPTHPCWPASFPINQSENSKSRNHTHFSLRRETNPKGRQATARKLPRRYLLHWPTSLKLRRNLLHSPAKICRNQTSHALKASTTQFGRRANDKPRHIDSTRAVTNALLLQLLSTRWRQSSNSLTGFSHSSSPHYALMLKLHFQLAGGLPIGLGPSVADSCRNHLRTPCSTSPTDRLFRHLVSPLITHYRGKCPLH